MTLSVIIVNYNVKYFLEQCLCSLRVALRGLDAEVRIVDNGSTDGSVDYLRPLFPEVHFIENPDNPGFARANNQAIRASQGEYILLLNPDTLIGEDSLRSLCRFMDNHPEAGAAGVKMIDAHGAFLPESKRSFPSPWVSFCKLFGLSKCFPFSPLFAGYNLSYLDADGMHRVEVLAGAFMLLRREAIDRVGLLDESFFMYGEDIDLSYRIAQGGYVNYYIPERILHYKGESAKQDDARYIKSFYGAMLIFYRKYHPKAARPVVGMIRLAVLLMASLTALLKRLERRRKPHPRRRRLLLLCGEKRFKELNSAAVAGIPDVEYIEHWNTDGERSTDAIFQRNRVKRFTDWVFCHPDISFGKMLRLMDRNTDKRVAYHIYNEESKRMI